MSKNGEPMISPKIIGRMVLVLSHFEAIVCVCTRVCAHASYEMGTQSDCSLHSPQLSPALFIEEAPFPSKCQNCPGQEA